MKIFVIVIFLKEVTDNNKKGISVPENNEDILRRKDEEKIY